MPAGKAKQFEGVRMVDGKHILVKTTDWNKLQRMAEELRKLKAMLRRVAGKDEQPSG